ncbi:unnamed protein product [Amoebophrya sp. A25]|nr:unnamed protein product [Amoebophrya sp. A25]|eukprot:GSA25T00026487001.1
MGHFSLLFAKNCRTNLGCSCGGCIRLFYPGILMVLFGFLSVLWLILDKSLFNQQHDWYEWERRITTNSFYGAIIRERESSFRLTPFLWFSSTMIFSGLLASVLPMRLVHSVVSERTYAEVESGMMNMQLVYGVKRSVYWSAHFLFWYLIFIPFALIGGIGVVMYTDTWVNRDAKTNHALYAEGKFLPCLAFLFPVFSALLVSATFAVEAPTREKFQSMVNSVAVLGSSLGIALSFALDLIFPSRGSMWATVLQTIADTAAAKTECPSTKLGGINMIANGILGTLIPGYGTMRILTRGMQSYYAIWLAFNYGLAKTNKNNENPSSATVSGANSGRSDPSPFSAKGTDSYSVYWCAATGTLQPPGPLGQAGNLDQELAKVMRNIGADKMWENSGEYKFTVIIDYIGIFLNVVFWFVMLVWRQSRRMSAERGDVATTSAPAAHPMLPAAMDDERLLPADAVAEPEKYALVLHNLTKSFAGKKSLANDKISFAVKRGEIFGLLGHNGAGKTTMVSQIVGMIPCTDGDAWVDGKSIRSDPGAVQQRVSLCPQVNPFWDGFTLRAHATMFAKLRDPTRDDGEINAKIEEYAAGLGLRRKLDGLCEELSGGQKRRLWVLCSLLGKTPLVLMDEPTSGMDPQARRDFWQMLKRVVKQENRAVVFSTHYLEEADLLAQRKVILSAGRVMALGTSAELKRQWGVGYWLHVAVKPEVVPDDGTAVALLENEVGRNVVAMQLASAAVRGPSVSGGDVTPRNGGDVQLVYREKLAKGTDLLDAMAAENGGQHRELGKRKLFVSNPRMAPHFLSFSIPWAKASCIPKILAQLEPDTRLRATLEMTTLEEVFSTVGERAHRGDEHDPDEFDGTFESPATPGEDTSSGLPLQLRPRRLEFRAQFSALFRFRMAEQLLPDIRTYVMVGLFHLFMLVTIIAFNKMNQAPVDDQPLSGVEFFANVLAVGIGAVVFPAIMQLAGIDSTADILGREREEGILQHMLMHGLSPGAYHLANFCSFVLSHSLLVWLPLLILFVSLVEVFRGTAMLAVIFVFLCMIPSTILWAMLFGKVFGKGGRSTFAILGFAVPLFSMTLGKVVSELKAEDLPSQTPEEFSSTRSSFVEESSTSIFENATGAAPPTTLHREQEQITTTASTFMSMSSGSAGLQHWEMAFDGAMARTRISSDASYEESDIVAEDQNPDVVVVGSTPGVSFAQQPAAGGSSRVQQMLKELRAKVSAAKSRRFERQKDFLCKKAFTGQEIQIKYSMAWVLSTISLFLSLLFPGVAIDAAMRHIFNQYKIQSVFVVMLEHALKTENFKNLFKILETMSQEEREMIRGAMKQELGIDLADLPTRSWPASWYLFGTMPQEVETLLDNETLWRVYPEHLGESKGCRSDNFFRPMAWMLVWAPFWNLLFVTVLFFLSFSCDSCKRGRKAITRGELPQVVDDMSRDGDVKVEEQRVMALRSGSQMPVPGGAQQMAGDDADKVYVQDVRKRFYDSRKNPFWATAGVSFGVKKGESFGLLGPNGAGKTTLFNMLSGDLNIGPPDTGAIVVDGTEQVDTQFEHGYQIMGLCPQFDKIWPKVTAEGHLRLYARLCGQYYPPSGATGGENETLMGREGDWGEKRIQRFLREVSLSAEDAKRPSGGYSGGMKRKLSVAFTLITDPELVFFDEMSAGVDIVAQRALWTKLIDRPLGQTIVSTTHSMVEADSTCDKLAILVGGRLQCFGSTARIKQVYGSGFHLELILRNADAIFADEEEGPAASNGSRRRSSYGNIVMNARSAGMSHLIQEDASSRPLVQSIQNFLQSRGVNVGGGQGGLSITTLEKMPFGGGRGRLVLGIGVDQEAANPAAAQKAAENAAPLRVLSPIFEWCLTDSMGMVEDFSLGEPTLEQIFLRFAKQQELLDAMRGLGN